VYFNQILNEDAGCSSYVIASRKTNEAVVIDPALAIDRYLQLAEHRGLTILMVIDTHIHADHISGARRLAAAVGAELAMHESADVLFPFRGLKDNEKIQLGQLELEILHTPGHRPEMISVLITNPERGDEPSMVLTGDSMFVGDIGRPDFGGVEGAKQQFESVHRLLQLPDYVEVFPAHFEGSCGKGMCGRPSSTVGFERRHNPALLLDEAGFIAEASEAPARPLNMTAIIATNRGEAEHFHAEPRSFDKIVEIDAASAPAWIKEHQVHILDVREPFEYVAAHIEGADLLPQAELAGNLDVLKKDEELLVVCAGGVRSRRAAQYLLANGYTKVTSLGGGMGAWHRAGLPVEGHADEGDETPDVYFHGRH
jgi:glyoxylase-like metal-dependent hydrolase (beta-lactamase superfamily II)/rhodanese-related sulfurtransferase